MEKRALEQISILLVEDDDVSIFLSIKALRLVGLKNIEVAKDGEQALELIKAGCFDLILLDLNLPIMDGFEFLEEKEKENLCPVSQNAVITSSIRQKDRQRALKHDNIVDYVVKPLETEVISELVKKVTVP